MINNNIDTIINDFNNIENSYLSYVDYLSTLIQFIVSENIIINIMLKQHITNKKFLGIMLYY
ncbi:MAG: hypothetical protein K0S93_2277 [Nitrososphaeraceae archaeon]|jgi:hypothetical protein|nr:hypothetical protein [Nitrososphaeraceae archaeon]